MNNNLSNLSWGTHKTNIEHKKIHGTENFGERNGNYKHKLEDVLKIRAEFEEGLLTVRQLAEKHGIPYKTVLYFACNKKRWARATSD